LRTIPRAGWRRDLASAFAIVAHRPSLWLIGMLGFSLRGGILLLFLPMVVLPTQVEVRFMLGDYLGSAGLTPGFWSLMVIVGAVAAVLGLGVLLLLARLELTAFEELTEAPESAEQRGWREATLSPMVRRRLIGQVFLVELAALVVLAACAVPLVAAIGQATIDELLRPTSSGSIYLRVLADVRDPLLLCAAAVALIELFSAAAGRVLLVRGAGLRGQPVDRERPATAASAAIAAVARPIRSPLGTLLAAGIGWAVWLAAVLVAVLSIGAVWQVVMASFLSAALTPDLVVDAVLFFLSVAFAAVFVLALLLCGMASAVRASLWSIEAFR
jgi:hypothetical protein